MATFKMLHGDESNISLDVTPFHEGWAYITSSGYYYVDLNIGTAESPNNQRIKLNSHNAETLAGMSLDEIKQSINYNDLLDKPVVISTVNGIAPDQNGNVEITGGGASVSGGIIDVLKLPTENIKTDVFYRLLSGSLIFNAYIQEMYAIHCVETLPEVGLPATNLIQSEGNVYYQTSNGEAYGYVDAMLSAGIGVPEGWYDASTLLGALGFSYSGTITDIDDDPYDDSFRILLSSDFYIYQDGWCKVPVAYEKKDFDIQWDGDMSDKFVLDMSALGFDGIKLTKISDTPLSVNELLGCEVSIRYADDVNYEGYTIEDYDIDTSAYPGGITIRNGEIVSIYSADDANAALGLPAGYLTNGLYFFYYTSESNSRWVSRLTARVKIKKIDNKYFDINVNNIDGLAYVAITGDYNALSNRPTDMIHYNSYQSISSSQQNNVRNTISVYSKWEVDNKIASVNNNIDLSPYAKTADLDMYAKTTDLDIYAKTADVETMITTAIGAAIGGSY
jgi:hypothetical protein